MENSTAQLDGAVIPLDTDPFRWSDLPKELQFRVFECFVAGPLPMGSGRRLSADIVESRKALLNLCRTSSHCYDVAMPMLYRHVIITDYIQLQGLLATLFSHMYRRSWTRSISVLAGYILPEKYNWLPSLRSVTFVEDTLSRLREIDAKETQLTMTEGILELRDVLALVRTLYRVVLDLPGSGDEYIRNFDNFPWKAHEFELCGCKERLLQLLFRFQTNVKDIFVTVPGVHTQHLCPLWLKSKIMRQFQLDPSKNIREDPFQSLRSIRKQYSPSSLRNLRPSIHAPEYRKSTHWELFRDDGDWNLRKYLDERGWPSLAQPRSRDLKIFSHVVKLGLYESRTHPATLRMILGLCESLKEFEYTTNALYWEGTFGASPPGDDELESDEAESDEAEQVAAPTLQQALEQVRATLTHLRVGWAPWGATSMEEAKAAVADHHINLRGFVHIESVQVDPLFLLVDDSDDRDSTNKDDHIE